MKTKYFLAFAGLGISVGLHGYLFAEYYPLHFGLASGQSLCNLNALFDCNAVSASSYSSVFGIPLAAFGLTYNAILLGYLAMIYMGFTSQKERALREAFWMANGSIAASLLMAAISLFLLKNICLFCLLAYVMSILVWFSIYGLQDKGVYRQVGADVGSWLTSDKSQLVKFLLVPVLAFFVHTGMVQSFGAEEIDRVIQSTVVEWQNNPAVNWSAKPSLNKGASVEKAKMTIVEFADFLCGHCRQAAPSLAAFVKSREDVRLLFFSFPLDGTCNSAIDHNSFTPCFLAKVVYCADQQSLGWEVHDLIYANQEALYKAGTPSAASSLLKSVSTDLNALNWEKINGCIDAPATADAIKAQAEQGQQAKVLGTPTIFVNGKKLERGQLIPVLEAVYKSL